MTIADVNPGGVAGFPQSLDEDPINGYRLAHFSNQKFDFDYE